MKIGKIAGIAVGASIAFAAFAPMASAVTVADLQAQINQLMAQLAALQGGSSATTGAAISSDLTVGSRGADVTTLQNALIAQGYLGAGLNTGYFGSLTKAAVMKWQAASGVPSTGYFGPLSRAKFNGSAGATGTVPGTTIGGITGSSAEGAIATPGAEGSLSVTSAPVSTTNVYAGDTMDAVVAFNARASNSDLLVQRLKIDLGTSANVYNKVFNKVYLVNDAGNVIASADLNGNTVVKEGDSIYYITLSGFSSLVKKDAQRTYTVKMGLMPSIDSTYRTSYTIRLAANGVRAVDGAGINLYSPTNATDVSRSVTVGAALTDSASLTVSADPSTPNTREVVASSGSSNNQADKVVLLVFNVRADKDDVTITDMKNFVVEKRVTGTTASGATASTTYLFEGSGINGTLLGSASVSANDADFTNIKSVIAKGTSKTYTLAADVASADAVQATFSASTTGNTTNFVGNASNGTVVGTVTGSGQGNNLYVRNVGPVFTLNSVPTIAYTAAAGYAGATSTAKAHFDLKITAVGSDIEFGGSASTTYPLAGNTVSAGTSTPIYFNGSTVITTGVAQSASSTSMTVPASGLVTSGIGSNSYKLQQNNSVNIGIDYVFEGRRTDTAGNTYPITTGSYAVALEKLNWVASAVGRGSSTFMAGDTSWRTGTVVMP